LKKNAQILSGLNKKQKGQKKKETALCLHPFSCGENLHAPLFYFETALCLHPFSCGENLHAPLFYFGRG